MAINKQCIVIQHVQFEDLGTFSEPIDAAGYSIEYLQVGIDNLDAIRDADLVVILGGPIGVYELTAYPYLADEIAIAKYRLENNLPILGVCLGGQIIAHAAGAKVYPGAKGKELGWYPIHLTAKGEQSVLGSLSEKSNMVLHWHGDTFDLPATAELLASSQQYTNQAFSIGNNALALQFHPELDASKIEYWLIGHALEITTTADITVERIRQDTQKYGPTLMRQGKEIVRSWLGSLDG